MTSPLIFTYRYGKTVPNLLIEGIEATENLHHEMVWFANEQIKIQKAARNEIARRTIEGAEIVASEIDQQTHKLERGIQQLESNVSTSVLFAADQISEAIHTLGDHICADLGEIKWQLAQQSEVLDKILGVLRQSRRNEAQQLVHQGIRLFINGEYEDAEKRFRLALEVDPTDYQVLMNLGFIEIHKDNAAGAHRCFKKAFSLPANVDSVYKARTLFAIARLHYAEQEYKNASSHAEQALKLNAVNDAEDIFRAGVYAALGGDTSLAIKRIDEAIILNPALFAIAAVEPDLQPIRKDVLALLSNISIAAKNKAAQVLLEVRKDLSASVTHKEHRQYSDLISMAENHLIKAETLLHKPSYSDCLDALTNLKILRDVTPEIGALPHHYATRQQLEKQLKELAKQLKEAEERHSKCDAKCEAKVRAVPEVTRPRPFDDINYVVAASLAGLVGYFVVGHMLWMEAGHPKGAVRLLYLLFWPIGIGLELLLALFGATDWVGNEALTILLGFSPVALIVIVLVVRRAISVGEHRHYEELLTRRTQLRAQLCNELAELSKELAELSKEISRARNSLGAVDHEISGYRHRITQKIGEFNWK